MSINLFCRRKGWCRLHIYVSKEKEYSLTGSAGSPEREGRCLVLGTGIQFCEIVKPQALRSRFVLQAWLTSSQTFNQQRLPSLPPSTNCFNANHPREGYLGPWNVLVLGILLSSGLLGLGSSWRWPTHLGRWWGEHKQGKGHKFGHQDIWTRHWWHIWPEGRPRQQVRDSWKLRIQSKRALGAIVHTSPEPNRVFNEHWLQQQSLGQCWKRWRGWRQQVN